MKPVLCELLLRGPQTPGELRGRTERLHPMEDIADVQSTLQRMMEREPALVAVLPRQPGTKEVRYTHLLSGMPDVSLLAAPDRTIAPRGNSNSHQETDTRIAVLEQQVSSQQQQIDQLTKRLEELLTQLG